MYFIFLSDTCCINQVKLMAKFIVLGINGISGGAGLMGLMSSHPSLESRIAALQKASSSGSA